MGIDCAGTLYVASQNRVVLVNPTGAGTSLGTISVNAQSATKVAFGGANHQTLYVSGLGTGTGGGATTVCSAPTCRFPACRSRPTLLPEPAKRRRRRWANSGIVVSRDASARAGEPLAAAGVAALAMMSGAARVVARDDTRELKAREEFAAGRYQALDLFAKLYAHAAPGYLRNIGTVPHQNLAILTGRSSAFRDYLRKHKTISAEEAICRAFIAEMEELKKQRGASATPPPETSTAPPQAASTITPPPSAP